MCRGNSKEPSLRNACFFCIQTHIFVRIGPSVRYEENNNFLIQLYLQPNSFKLNLLKVHFEMSETRALRFEKSENLNGSLFVDNHLRKGIGFEICDRICTQN